MSTLYTTRKKKENKPKPKDVKITTIAKNKAISPIKLEDAIITLESQLQIENKRPRTISTYIKWTADFFGFCEEKYEVSYLDDLEPEMLFSWLSHFDVSDSTKNIRLKSVKAMLGRCKNNGWLRYAWWLQVQIRVDEKIKEATTELEINLALNYLDLGDFFDLRDAVAILLIFETGIRNSTFAQLREAHIDFQDKIFLLPPDIMKGRKSIALPFSNNLKELLLDLIEVNKRIRANYQERNDFIFINRLGKGIHQTGNSNVIQKRMIKLSQTLGVSNLSPHALRRAFATNLYKKGASIPVISKALGHSDLSITHKYLHIDQEEVIDELRRFNNF